MSAHGPVDTSASRLKVLDLGTLVGGPVVATLLGDLGAEVIKVERPGVGDTAREGGLSARWEVEGRNKRSVTVDLHTEPGQDLVRRLARWADVLVENFRPGTMSDWGLGYEQLAQVNSRLVYVSVSAYGQDGPYRRRAGYDNVGGAFGGLAFVSGYPDRPPVLPGLPVVDYATAAFATVGALEAVRRRDLPGGTGRGAWVDCALYESMLRMSGVDVVNYWRHGAVREREGGMPTAKGPTYAPQTFTYRTRDDRWVAFYVALDAHFATLTSMVGDPELTDPRFATKRLRTENGAALDAILRRWFATQGSAELVEMMDRAGLPFSPVYSVADMVADPHLDARENLVVVPSSAGDDVMMVDAFPRLERGTGIRWAGEQLGASNDDVFRGLLGLSDTELARLTKAGVI